MERLCGFRGSFYRSPRCSSCFVDLLQRMLGRLGSSYASAPMDLFASHTPALSAAEQNKMYGKGCLFGVASTSDNAGAADPLSCQASELGSVFGCCIL